MGGGVGGGYYWPPLAQMGAAGLLPKCVISQPVNENI